MHRGQGIELPVAVLIAHPAAGAFFLRREMLYTAMTRATMATVVVGTARGRRARGGDARHLAAPRPARRAARGLSRPQRATALESDSPRMRRRSRPVYWIESWPPAAAAREGSGWRSDHAPRWIRAR